MRRALFVVCLPLLVGTAASAGTAYEGKYRDDPRLARIRGELPGRAAAARRKLEELLGVEMPEVEIRLEDAGKDRSGVWAETRGAVLVLKTEYLVLGAYDLDATLVHELFHCLHRTRVGEERYGRTPLWAREGAALWVAGQGDERARALAAFAGRDPRIDEPVARLVDGLEGRHTLLDYYEDVAAFDAVAARHGRAKALALVKGLLDQEGGGDVPRLIREVTGEDFARFEQAAAAHARRVLRPLVEKGRAEILAMRRLVEAGAWEEVAAAPLAGGVYAPAARYYRALALHRAGRSKAALKLLDGAARSPTLIAETVRLRVSLLEATGNSDHAVAAKNAELDLTAFAPED